jgi:hypothetical protein
MEELGLPMRHRRILLFAVLGAVSAVPAYFDVFPYQLATN